MILRYDENKPKMFLEEGEEEFAKIMLELLLEYGNTVQKDVARNLLNRMRRGDGWTLDQARIFEGWCNDYGYPDIVKIPDTRTPAEKMKEILDQKFAEVYGRQSNVVDFRAK